MRHLILLGMLAITATLALPAYAGLYVKIHGTHNHLTWHASDGRTLELASTDCKGILVDRIAPAGRDGLQQGDAIIAVDGQPVTQVFDLVTYANAHLQAASKLTVHRGHGDLQLALPGGELAALVHPSP